MSQYLANHGWLGWIIIGLIAGAIAKALMPGRDPGGCIITIIRRRPGGLPRPGGRLVSPGRRGRLPGRDPRRHHHPVRLSAIRTPLAARPKAGTSFSAKGPGD